MEETKNLFQRLLAIENEIPTIEKNSTITNKKGGKFNAVKESDVLTAVKPLEHKYGVYSYPLERTIMSDETENGCRYIKLQVTYRFLNVDNPDEHIDITSFGDGMDYGDKAPGKAMTYADKYALMKAYKIATGEDPDLGAPKKKAQQAPDLNKITLDFNKVVNELMSVGVNVHEQNIKLWVWEKVGIGPDEQDIKLDDLEHTQKLMKAYNSLLKAKKK